ncbi:CsgG/HfaB family protein [Saccharophagus degradans]|uniref:CsgG/HfaB family protein n=1 Tax=Saccharophagus degradans TaxID=86304 RepID=UPI001C0828B4|nr:CsgG/HfaB family protein [Saccharophagus degradans]MBU2987120.1 CsgG/HfaB family protein [Saccharophagus degradans]
MKIVTTSLMVALLCSCASQDPRLKDVEPTISEQQQREAQAKLLEAQATKTLALKRKIAVGRLSNETSYGKSLLGSSKNDVLGEKVSDMFVQSLANSGNYLIFERPDLELLENEARLTGETVNLIGVDTLVIGSLTQFGRNTTGESGFLSSSKKQEATATVDLRLVETKTGRVFASVTGTGSSSTETARTMGFGSVAGYDGSINDQAIGAAVNAAVEKLNKIMLEKTWSADVLAVEEGQVFISGGKHQGIKTGMNFDVFTKGKAIKSSTTGSVITLPGKKVAAIKIEGLFGDSELEEGAFGSVTEGSVSGLDVSTLEVREKK